SARIRTRCPNSCANNDRVTVCSRMCTTPNSASPQSPRRPNQSKAASGEPKRRRNDSSPPGASAQWQGVPKRGLTNHHSTAATPLIRSSRNTRGLPFRVEFKPISVQCRSILMSRSRILFASMSFLLAVACTSGQDESTPAAANWRIDSVPLVAIGDNEADSVPLIGFAIGVTAIGDSQLLVVDRDYHRLTFFDTDGRLVRTVGREGDGPGEFRFLARFARCGDSLVVQDIERDSWLVIGQDGEVARQFKPATPANARFGTPYVSTCNQAGAFLYGGWDSLPHMDRPTRARGAVPYWLTDRSGKLTVELGNWPGSERLLMPGGS